MNLFEVWFFKILLPHIEATREDDDKVVVVGDNLVSHFSPKVIEACRDKSIYMTPFPENASHLMQLLDVAVFTPIKKKWQHILDQWRKESRYPESLPKEQFPQLLQRLWIGIGDTVSENLKSAFRGTGLHPVNPDEVLKPIPEGLETNSVVSARTLDDSLIELPKEHRGTGEKTEPKRGKKIVPGANMSVVDEPAYTAEAQDVVSTSTPEQGASNASTSSKAPKATRESQRKRQDNCKCSICQRKRQDNCKCSICCIN
ncbi:DDE superfamily endonuclease [Popillia japonica]|uniref:DDE superfamily endonuclease n=1 Tax=Popillia japonica TaxID=7064 RepID=A0AAW1LUM1_POPJA